MRVSRLVGSWMLAALLVAALVAPASAGGGGGGGSGWTRLDSEVDSSLPLAGLGRSSDRALHAIWAVDTSATEEDYRHVRISPNGSPGAVNDVFGVDPESLTVTPKLIRSGSGIRLVFSGLPEENFLTATAPSAGTPFSAPADLGDWDFAYGTYGLGADVFDDGTLIVGGALNDELHWHVGLDPLAGNETATFDAEGSIVHSNLAVDRATDEAWMVWYSQDAGGIWAVRVEPTLGTPVRAPSSVDVAGDSLGPDQQVSLVSTDTGGLFTAYCVGYPTCTRAVVWQVGTSRVIPLPRSAGVEAVALGLGRGGRIWAVWEAGDRLWAARSNTDATRFGLPFDLGVPPQTLDVYSIAINGENARADIVANVQSGDSFTFDMWHARALPTLKVTASPRRVDGDVATQVTVRVTDAGEVVRGAKVRVAGQRCTTGATGTCVVEIGPSDPGRPVVTAAKGGYAPGTVRVTVR